MKLISFLALLGMSSVAAAASFDCRQSHTQVEKLICGEPTLSTLDDKLNQAYQSVLQGAMPIEVIRSQQKDWLRHVRNKCTTTSCLVDAYEARIHLLSSQQPATTRNGASCPLSDQKLRGAWERVSDTDYFEEMKFDYAGSEREFNSWLHHRPEIFGGTWKLENCVISIQHPSEETLHFALTVVRVQGNRIYVREEGEKFDTIYKRIPP